MPENVSARNANGLSADLSIRGAIPRGAENNVFIGLRV